MQANYARFQAKNAEIVALVVAPQSKVRALVNSQRYAYPVLADADHAVSSAYGVYNLLNDRLATPSVFIVDEAGLVTWVYAGKSAADRPSATEILNQLP